MARRVLIRIAEVNVEMKMDSLDGKMTDGEGQIGEIENWSDDEGKLKNLAEANKGDENFG